MVGMGDKEQAGGGNWDNGRGISRDGNTEAVMKMDARDRDAGDGAGDQNKRYG